MLDVFLLVAKILFYTTCAAYIRSLYKDKEYVPHEEYHLLRNECNRLIDYNKELKDKLLHQQYANTLDTVETTTLTSNSNDYASTTYYSKLPKEGWYRSSEPNPSYVPPKATMRVVSSIGDLYYTKDTGEIYVQVTEGNGNYLTGKE